MLSANFAVETWIDFHFSKILILLSFYSIGINLVGCLVNDVWSEARFRYSVNHDNVIRINGSRNLYECNGKLYISAMYFEYRICDGWLCAVYYFEMKAFSIIISKWKFSILSLMMKRAPLRSPAWLTVPPYVILFANLSEVPLGPLLSGVSEFCSRHKRDIKGHSPECSRLHLCSSAWLDREKGFRGNPINRYSFTLKRDDDCRVSVAPNSIFGLSEKSWRIFG